MADPEHRVVGEPHRNFRHRRPGRGCGPDRPQNHRGTIQLSYAIGVSKPLSIYCDTFGTGQVDPAAIEAAIPQVMDLSPRGIREHLSLNKPIYQRTAAYGHFGRAPDADGGFSWEKTDLAEALKGAV